jgi:response regulator RpfG family c-di-GMP phosphodiesterase
VLRGLDAEIVKATNGNDALKATLHHDFALALLDVQMPEMDGYELANILKTEEKTENLPFIFISAVYTDHQNISKGYTRGAYNFFAKPFDPETLIRSVELFLEKYNRAAQQAVLNKRLDERNREVEQKNKEATTSMSRSERSKPLPT